MNARPSLTLALAVTSTLSLFAAPTFAGSSLQMIVVAEKTDPRAPAPAPSLDHPIYYVAFDGGYIEAGDPIANERPPGAPAVAQALQNSLVGLGYRPAPAGTTPALVFTYHWGLLDRDSLASRIGASIDRNLHARLSLMTVSRKVNDIETYILDRRLLGRTNPAFRSPVILGIKERDALELANDNRYFFILSAYDYAPISRQESKLLWRVRASTLSVGVSMADALPTLIQGGAPFLGRNLNDGEYVKIPLITAPGGEPADGLARFAPPLGNTGSLDGPFLRGLMKQEHEEFAGLYPSRKTAYDPILVAESGN